MAWIHAVVSEKPELTDGRTTDAGTIKSANTVKQS